MTKHSDLPTVAVVFGSRSTEHDISILTALASVIKPLELSKKYRVVPVYIAKDGTWYAGDIFKDISLFQSEKIDEVLAHQEPLSVQLGGGLQLVTTRRLKRIAWKIDVVFPATHGTHGEDGELMALCELAGVPYVGCDVVASVVAMDKVLAKQTVAAEGIATPKYVAFSKAEYAANDAALLKRIKTDLRYPLFVKPAHLGSSIGISRVTSAAELENAIEVALHYDSKALVEEGVENLIEVTLPIMGNDSLRPALLEEPLLKSEDFFDFETKYMQGGKGKGGAKKSGSAAKQGAQGYSRIPAELPRGMYEEAEAIGLHVYKAIGCSGIARIDMLVDTEAKKVYFNEVNPLPGSLYAHNWAKAGVSNVQLVTTLVELALEKFATKQAVATGFQTNYLKQF